MTISLPRMLGLLAAILAPMLAASTGTAAPLGSEYLVTATPPVSLTDAEKSAIEQQFDTAVEFQRNKSGWQCVLSNAEMLQPLAPHAVVIEAVVSEDEHFPGDMEVTVKISVGSTLLSRGSASIPQALVDPNDRRPALAGKARDALQSAMDTAKPCAPKVKLKLRHHASAGITFDRNDEGEGQLALLADGSFSTTISSEYTMSAVESPAGTCTFSPDSGQNSVDVAGFFDDADGTLSFTSMAWGLVGGSTIAMCQTPGGSFSLPIPLVPAPTITTDTRVALQDGAESVIPMQTEASSDELTIDLMYDQGAVAVAEAPGDR